MIKVMHVITRLDLGGAQQNTLYTAGHLDPERFRVILAAGPGGALDAQAASDARDPGRGYLLRFFPSLVRPLDLLRDPTALLQLFRFIRQQEPAVVHTHSSKAGVLGRIAAWMAGVPVVLHTYHGFGFHERQSKWLKTAYVLIERLCCRLSTRLVFVSRENQRYAERCGLPVLGRSALIRSGIALRRFPAPLQDKARKKASLGCRVHEPLVLSVGNLKPQKNPEAFLRIASLCLRETPEASFVFIGDGELRSSLEARVLAHGLSGKVFFPGWRLDIPEILAAADLFLMTSLWEGLPRALLEAMKTGLPCVCYATDGVRDVLRDGENGFLIEPGDERTAARRVLELLGDSGKARALGRCAAASIGPEFDIDAMVRNQEELYLDALRAARRDARQAPA